MRRKSIDTALSGITTNDFSEALKATGQAKTETIRYSALKKLMIDIREKRAMQQFMKKETRATMIMKSNEGNTSLAKLN